MNFTKAERDAIRQGWYVLQELANINMSDSFLLGHMLKKEQSAFSERIPKIQAQALMIKWFLEGVRSPHKPARSLTGVREAAIWAICYGAALEYNDDILCGQRETLESADDAYATAAQRHHEKSLAEMREAMKRAQTPCE